MSDNLQMEMLLHSPQEPKNVQPQKTGEYIEVMLNDFLLNAGVVGLLRVFLYADNYDDGCIEGEDYIIKGQSLLISRDYLENHDIADLFIRSLVHYLGEDTKFTRILQEKHRIDQLYEAPAPEDKAWKKSADELFKNFTEMLMKSSFRSGYNILASEKGILAPTAAMVEALKKEPDYLQKKEKYNELHRLLQQEKVQETLNFKDILYSIVTMFYADNKGNGAAFLSQREVSPANTYAETFIAPLLVGLDIPTEKKTETCIQCGCKMDKTPKIPISRFVDTADDLGKKKSYYWNCNPDAYLCPLCAFICSLAPLGFHYYGNEAVFINNNSDIHTLMAFAQVLKEKGAEEEKNNPWFRLYNSFTSEKIDKLEQKINNIQVVIRDGKNARYRMNTIDKGTLSVLDAYKKELTFLQSQWVKDGKEFINVYQQTVENILNMRSQFPTITKLLRIALRDGGQTYYLWSILAIQIHQRGGEGMAENIKRAYVAKKQGEILRAKLTESLLMEKDKDNKLRGLVYQLLNAASLGNRDKFMELVIRTYAGCNLPVPDIFFSCFGSDEDFKETAFAYLLGLKSEEYKKEEEKK